MRGLIVVILGSALLASPAISLSTSAPVQPGASVHEALVAMGALAGVPETSLAPMACGSLPDALAAFAARFGLPAPLAPIDIPRAEADALARLVCTLHAATLARDAAFADVDPAALVREIGRETGEPGITLSVDHVAASAAGARAIALAVDEALQVLAPAPVRLLAPSLAPPQYNFPPILAMDLVGQDTLYADDVALIVDVGGNDIYDNNAGGSLIAFGDGNFLPIQGDPSSFGQSQCVTPTTQCSRVVVGGDFEDAELLFSASLLLDLAGDDTYGVPRAPWHDRFCTSEPVVRKVVIQGSGAGGPGLLFDLAGNNQFRAKTVAQGTGHVGGVGVLYTGAGNDRLEAVRMAQGSGLFFGLGLLMDEGGDDTYIGRAPAGGAFNTDGSFCDDQPRYLHGSGFARVTGGASGVAGFLIERGGNDIYVGDTKGAGFAEVASLGLFLDQAGDDTHVAVQSSLGYASGHPATSGGGVGVFVDAAGNDRYTLTTTEGLGATPAPIAQPGDVPMPYTPYTFWIDEVVTTFVNPVLITGAAVFYDGGGNDAYDSPAPRANGEVKPTTIGGVFVDQ